MKKINIKNQTKINIKRRMHNKKYCKAEEAIKDVLLKSREMPGAKELAERARISRSTLYRHHRAIPEIMSDYERDILQAYDIDIKKFLRNNNLNLKDIYITMLAFVMQHRKTLEILFKFNGDKIIEKMVLKLKSKINTECYLPKNSKLIMQIYAKEVAGIVENWGKQKFSEKEFDKTLANIIYLTRTMRLRLVRIAEESSNS